MALTITKRQSGKAISRGRAERLEDLIATVENDIHKPMSLKEFLERWVEVPANSSELEYRQACRKALVATGFSESEIRSWSKRTPNYLPLVLRLVDIIKRVQKLGICLPNNRLYGTCNQPHINLPSAKLPKFVWGATVSFEGKAGKIEGLNWVDNHWDYKVRFYDGAFQAVDETELSSW